MRNHTCLPDHHQRSHYDTITVGPEGKFNWVLQLINSQKVRLFDSLEGKFNMQRSPNLLNQNPNQSVIDQGNLRTRKVCLLLKVKRPVPMRSMKKVFTKNSVLQIDQVNLMSVSAQVHTHSERTTCSSRTSRNCVIQHEQRVQSCNQRGGH